MKRILKIIFLALFLILVGSIPFLIRIKSIRCESQYGPCSPEIEDSLRGFNGKNYIMAKRSVNRYIANNSFIDSSTVEYSLPRSLKVVVIEEKPDFALASTNQNGYILMSRSGKVLGEKTETALPKLLPNEDNSSERVTFGGNLLVALFQWKGVHTATLGVNSMSVDLNDENRVIFPLEGDVDILLGSLDLLLSWLNVNAEGSKIEIDLRYNNPVLRNI